jgi:hypothetical protein
LALPKFNCPNAPSIRNKNFALPIGKPVGCIEAFGENFHELRLTIVVSVPQQQDLIGVFLGQQDVYVWKHKNLSWICKAVSEERGRKAHWDLRLAPRPIKEPSRGLLEPEDARFGELKHVPPCYTQANVSVIPRGN